MGDTGLLPQGRPPLALRLLKTPWVSSGTSQAYQAVRKRRQRITDNVALVQTIAGGQLDRPVEQPPVLTTWGRAYLVCYEFHLNEEASAALLNAPEIVQQAILQCECRDDLHNVACPSLEVLARLEALPRAIQAWCNGEYLTPTQLVCLGQSRRPPTEPDVAAAAAAIEQASTLDEARALLAVYGIAPPGPDDPELSRQARALLCANFLSFEPPLPSPAGKSVRGLC